MLLFTSTIYLTSIVGCLYGILVENASNWIFLIALGFTFIATIDLFYYIGVQRFVK